MPLTTTTLPGAPSSIWLQLSAAERGYLLLTNLGNVPLSRMLIARDRQSAGNSPSADKVTDSLRKMIPVLEASSQDGSAFAAMDARRLSEMRIVLAELEAVPVQLAAAE